MLLPIIFSATLIAPAHGAPLAGQAPERNAAKDWLARVGQLACPALFYRERSLAEVRRDIVERYTDDLIRPSQIRFESADFSPKLRYADVRMDLGHGPPRTLTLTHPALAGHTLEYTAAESQGCVQTRNGVSQPLQFEPATTPPRPVPIAWTTGWRAKPTESDEAARLHAAASSLLRDGGLTRALLISRPGKFFVEAYADGYNQNSLFNYWSISKSITAALAGRMLALGIGKLTDPIQKATGATKYPITLDMLIRQTSGLRCERDSGDENWPFWDGIGLKDDYLAREFAEMPNERIYYSDCHAALVQAFIRDKLVSSGRDYMAFEQREFFDQIGAGSIRRGLSDRTGLGEGAGFYIGNARDLVIFGELHLKNGKSAAGEAILPGWWSDYVAAPTPLPWVNRHKDKLCGGYGAAVFLQSPDPTCIGFSRRSYPSDTYYMSGSGGQTVAVIPSLDIVIVRIGNEVSSPALAAYVADQMSTLIAQLDGK
jgi:CubicO group peptidase (beta-lactamase class C family)